MSDKTLNETLADLGYTTRKAPAMYAKHVLRDGEIVFTGDAAACWEWVNRLKDKG